MTDRPLTDIMEFDHVIEVHPDGSITDRRDIWAPELRDGELEQGQPGPWELLNGFSGQDRYAGPIMHPSEYIGGGMERYIRETPGIYVSLVAYYTPENPDDNDGDDIEGWAVAFRES